MVKKNLTLYNQAKKILVGGVNSPVRSFFYTASTPLIIKSAKGSKLFDYNGNSFIDYSLSFGANILGHANKDIVADLKKRIESGFSFGLTNQTEIELAKKIIGAIPFIQKLRFVNSGTEAVMSALRLARGYTKRDKILKFEYSYHGHADYLLAKSGSGLATLGIPASSGVPKDFVKHTLIAPHGDYKSVKKIIKKHGREIAAVIVEPVGGNFGVIPPDINFLKDLRKLASKSGSLLVFDEVITGFRFNYGSSAQAFGVVPDIICLGKIIGGGLPIGAFGANNKIMRYLAPLGDVYQASTFAGNPVVMQAGLSTLKILKKSDYKRLEDMARSLCVCLEDEASKRKINLCVARHANMFSLKFAKKEQFRLFYGSMLGQGVYLAPSEFEANFISFAHSENDINKTRAAFSKALNKISVVC